MKKTLLALSIAATAAPSISNADTILGLYAGIGQWKAGFGGDIGDEASPTSIDEFGFKDENSNIFWAKFEHPVPFIPNIMLKSTDLTTTSQRDFTDTVDLGSEGSSLAGLTGNVETDLDLSHIDATLYYEILDNWLTLDVGLTARKFSGHFNVYQDQTAVDESKISGTIPLLYLSAQFDLPLTGFHVGLNTHAISAGDNKITDTSVFAGYSTDLIPLFDIGVNVGYRNFSLSIDELDDTYVDLGFDGAFLELTAHF